jgi:hypothetical protein
MIMFPFLIKNQKAWSLFQAFLSTLFYKPCEGFSLGL